MSSSRVPGGRWLMLALLAALVFGPAGAGAVFHDADDAACAPREVSGGLGMRGPALTAPTAARFHCAVCHLLRSIRWGLSAAPALPLTTHIAVAMSRIDPIPVADGTHLATPGRSPPLTSSLLG